MPRFLQLTFGRGIERPTGYGSPESVERAVNVSVSGGSATVRKGSTYAIDNLGYANSWKFTSRGLLLAEYNGTGTAVSLAQGPSPYPIWTTSTKSDFDFVEYGMYSDNHRIVYISQTRQVGGSYEYTSYKTNVNWDSWHSARYCGGWPALSASCSSFTGQLYGTTHPNMYRFVINDFKPDNWNYPPTVAPGMHFLCRLAQSGNQAIRGKICAVRRTNTTQNCEIIVEFPTSIVVENKSNVYIAKIWAIGCPPPPESVTVTPQDNGQLLAGKHSYYTCFYSPALKTYSSVVLGNGLVVSEQSNPKNAVIDIQIDRPHRIIPWDYNKIYVYRNSSERPYIYKVAEIDLFGISNTVITGQEWWVMKHSAQIVDNNMPEGGIMPSDAEKRGVYPNVNVIRIYNGRLWGLYNNKSNVIRFSSLGLGNSQEYWPQDAYTFGLAGGENKYTGGEFVVGDGVPIMGYVPEIGAFSNTGIAGGSLLVLKRDTAFRIFGSDWESFDLKESFKTTCISGRTIVNCNGTVFWLGSKNVYALEAGSSTPVDVSSVAWPEGMPVQAPPYGSRGFYAAFYDNKYFVSGPWSDGRKDATYIYDINSGVWTELGVGGMHGLIFLSTEYDQSRPEIAVARLSENSFYAPLWDANWPSGSFQIRTHMHGLFESADEILALKKILGIGITYTNQMRERKAVNISVIPAGGDSPVTKTVELPPAPVSNQIFVDIWPSSSSSDSRPVSHAFAFEVSGDVTDLNYEPYDLPVNFSIHNIVVVYEVVQKDLK